MSSHLGSTTSNSGGGVQRSASLPEDTTSGASSTTATMLRPSDDNTQPHRNSSSVLPVRVSSSKSGGGNGKSKKGKGNSSSNNNKGAAANIPADLPGQVEYYKEQVALEKAGKRKLFHSLVKLANELRKMKDRATPMEEQREYYYNRPWYQGGLWRAPAVLPALEILETSAAATAEASAHPGQQQNQQQETYQGQQQNHQQQPPFDPQQPDNTLGLLLASPISLSDLFFSLVVVTAFTRVGVGVSQKGSLELSHLLYFAVFWTVWSKEASYSTRFDTTDLSASMTTLITSLAVLFACLSSQAPIPTNDGTRIMIMAGSVAILHCLLHVRVAMTTFDRDALVEPSPAADALTHHVRAYAIYNIVMNACEAITWSVGIFFLPVNWEHRWIVFALGIFFALRIPRAFLSNDFHAACSKRGVLFILLLGFLLQSIVVVASEFFEYQTPSLEDYAFLGAACLMFFCIKLLYVDDTTNRAEDHALLVNRWAGFFFNLGNFSLLLSTTVMGSGLNLLTHSYFAATAALPGPAKNLVCGGFSATLLSTLFIKSMHLKRVPTNSRHKAMFVAAWALQSVVLLGVVAIAAFMCLSTDLGGWLGYLMNSDIQLLFALSGSALVVVILSWLDEGVELALYSSVDDSHEFRIAPFGFWWCLTPEVSDEEVLAAEVQANEQVMYSSTTRNLSALSPLLGSSIADLKRAMGGYDSVATMDV